jgi:hypothetical protein
MDYQVFQNFIKKHDFDQSDLSFLNDVMKYCSIPEKIPKPKKKLYSLRLNEEDMIKLKKLAKEQ